MLPYIVTILGAYLIGCSNMALYLSRWKGVNLRAGGSKNLGASNAFALMGWKAGLLVAVHDIGKAVLAVELSKWIFPAVPLLGFIAGVACVLGHMFPFYLKFKGGKGFASYLGMILAINWKVALCILAAVVILTVLTDYIVVGTVTERCLVPDLYRHPQRLAAARHPLRGDACHTHQAPRKLCPHLERHGDGPFQRGTREI